MQSGFYIGDMFCQPHFFQLPLDYQNPEGKRIQIFAREVVARGQENSELPWLVYLQGGPGFPSPRPEAESGWLKRALKDYRVLLLDQRGTGQSTPVHAQTLAGLTAQQQADYLCHFRADNIVRDAEAIRDALGLRQWSLLGQSFGGFCALHYLSFYPDSLTSAFVTGGIPPIAGHADEVYRATYRRVLDKNAAFFKRFPAAQALCNRIADHLLTHDVFLPNGQRFTVEQFQLIGINLGRGGGDLALYYQLESAFVEVNGQPELSYSFLNAMLAEQSYQTNPIYAILHESIYCQQQASGWSAHRVRDEYPQCHYQPGQDFCFTGEMVYPWMFEQLDTLKPLREAAAILAEKADWPMLYDASQLAVNKVPLAAAVYVEDMYVEFDYSRDTLAGIPNSKAWMTNEFEHNGLRADGERILDTLIRFSLDIQDQFQG
ncbi:alpha/beta fold hydrolase [Photobacterium halotolerans]|uniref:Alpha/beta hydrolase n=1 Tax=Photobacterium halotolerans TaxID=265726 RepID=A0A0F5VD83_9GAMM|nr:alpha/beta fold hydrolase [Photobacterium halotolerans]KKC99761.1 alpha/beta hydrolase [Photobacterium halotolerans]